MSTINGTVDGVSLLSSNHSGAGDDRRLFAVSCSFAAYTGASDSMTVTGILTAIANHERNGKVLTLLEVTMGGAGLDTNAQAVYIQNRPTLSNQSTTGDISGNLTTSDGSTEITASTACSGVRMFALVKEA